MPESYDLRYFRYDVISGVSVGSLNGLLVSQSPIGDEKQMVSHLSYVIINNLLHSPIKCTTIGITSPEPMSINGIRCNS